MTTEPRWRATIRSNATSAANTALTTAPFLKEPRWRAAIKMGAMSATAIALIIAPILMWAAQSAAKADLQPDVFLSPSAILHVMGAHRMPQTILTPAVIVSMAFWMWTQMWEIAARARDGRYHRITGDKGMHFTVAFIWLECAVMLLNQYEVSTSLEIAAETLAVIACAGMLWRALASRAVPDDPYSSTIGRTLPAIDAAKALRKRAGRRKQ